MTDDKLETARQQHLAHYGFGTDAMKKIRICTRCKTPCAADTYFCTECGFRLPEDTLYDLYSRRHRLCADCDTALTAEMAFCPHCGTKNENNNVYNG